MSLEEREGVLDRVSENGILLSGTRMSYSKWFEGNRLTEDALGCKIRVVVDAGEKCTFLKKVIRIGEKDSTWKPPEPDKKGFFGGGSGRRMSPEELDLKREEGVRIARSVAVDKAIMMVREGVTIEQVVPLAQAIEEYVLKGKPPLAAKPPEKEGPKKTAPGIRPSAVPEKTVPASNLKPTPMPAPAKGATPANAAKPKKLSAKVVGALFNEAMRGGLVEDWQDFLARIEEVLRAQVRNPYQLSAEEFGRVEAVIRSKLGKNSAA